MLEVLLEPPIQILALHSFRSIQGIEMVFQEDIHQSEYQISNYKKKTLRISPKAIFFEMISNNQSDTIKKRGFI